MEKGKLYIVRTENVKLLKALQKQQLLTEVIKLEGQAGRMVRRGRPKKTGRPGRPPKA